MKKTVFLRALCLVLCLALLAACSGEKAPSQYGSSADYKAVIEAARPAELNELAMYAIVTGSEDDMHDIFFDPAFGFVEDDMERYAVSIGTIITLAYGVAIILPKEGHQQAVIDQLQNYVTTQQNAMENYLQDQYAIAKDAIIKTAPTGEVLLAMCEDADVVMAAMEEGLKG